MHLSVFTDNLYRMTDAAHPLMSADAGEGLTLYHRIYVRLRQMIRDGVFEPTTPLPSEPSLADMLAVSRATVRRALGMLVAEGLVERRHGIGTFPVPGGAPAGAVGGPADNLITIGFETEARTLAAAKARPPASVARLLQLSPSALSLRLVRLRSHAGQPFSHSTVYVPPTIAAAIDLDALGSDPVARALKAAGYRPARAEQSLTATLADADIGVHLQVPAGAPLTVLRRIVYAADGAPLLHQESRYRPDRYEYRMTLTREQPGPGPRWTPVD